MACAMSVAEEVGSIGIAIVDQGLPWVAINLV